MVKDLVKKGLSALGNKQTNIFSAAFFIILTTIFSQILGVLKYRILVSVFGSTGEAGVFLASFRLPDFIFQVLIGSVFSSAFIPVFSDYIVKGEKKEANNLASSLITIGLTLFLILSIIMFVFSYELSALVAPGFSQEGLFLMSNTMKIILLAQVFFVLGTASTAILQSYHHFLIPGIASSLYNAGIIAGLIFFAPSFGIYGAAVGVLLGSILYFFVQTPLLNQVGFTFRFLFTLKESTLKVLKLMVPRSFTLLVTQVSILANLFFASFIHPREISYLIFDLAQTLVVAPVTLFGGSIAQASFPALSQKKDDKREFLSIFLSSFTQIIYLTLPIAALFIVLRVPLVRLFYGASKFDWPATVSTGYTLSFFALSLSAQAIIFLVSRAFYAFKDTKTPFLITLVSVLMNIILSYLFVFIFDLPIYYLAFSHSIATIVGVTLLFIFLNQKILLPKFEIMISVVKILVSSLVMGVSLYMPIKLLDQLVFDTTRTVNLIILTGIASLFGISSYIFFTWLLDIKEAYYILAVIKKFGNWKQILKQVGELIDGSKLNP